MTRSDNSALIRFDGNHEFISQGSPSSSIRNQVHNLSVSIRSDDEGIHMELKVGFIKKELRQA